MTCSESEAQCSLHKDHVVHRNFRFNFVLTWFDVAIKVIKWLASVVAYIFKHKKQVNVEVIYGQSKPCLNKSVYVIFGISLYCLGQKTDTNFSLLCVRNSLILLIICLHRNLTDGGKNIISETTIHISTKKYRWPK